MATNDGHEREHDVVVVGARCAGSPLALQLAAAGHEVLLLDRASFPSDTISTHFIQLSGVARLARWGLLDAVRASGCPVITTGRVDFGAEPLEAETTGAGVPGNYAPRRTVLDKILVDGARAAGAEVAEGVFVEDVLRDGDRVTGVSGRDARGNAFTARARIVVGADGRNSFIARAVAAETYEETPSLGWGYYGYWSGVECDSAEIYFRDDRATVAFPTNDGLTLAAAIFPNREFETARKDIEGSVLATFDQMGTLGERVRGGTREEKLVGLREVPNYLRKPYGPGWALVGDAGYHKDPTPAQGISDAFRDAELLADALDVILSGSDEEDSALARYHAGRDEHARPMLAATIKTASFDLSPVERAEAFVELTMGQMQEATDLEPSPAS